MKAKTVCASRSREFTDTRRAMAIAFLLVAAAVWLWPATAGAQGPPEPGPPTRDLNGFSMGLILGDPTGFTLRGGIGERHAIQGHFGFSPFPGSGVVAMADWTYDAWDFLRDHPKIGLLFFFGFGVKGEWFTGHYFAYKYDGHYRLPDRRHFGLGLRGVVGLRIPFREAPFDVFFELAPAGIMLVLPGPYVHYDFDLAAGFRYRF